MEVFQYDPQHRRDVEGWNIICFDGEDKIGLTAQEWNDIAMDFIFNEMYDEAEKSYKRGIALGSYRSMAWLGSLYEKLNRLEEAYQCYLEAAMAKDRYALQQLSEMYRRGVYVPEDKKRAEDLIRFSEDKELFRRWKLQHNQAEGEES